MPFTFAHPAAVLPFSRKSRYIHFSALVLGSMAPDFEYFLRGQPFGKVGHTFSGFLFLNLPLVTITYLIYHVFIHQTLFNHLPSFLQDRYTNKLDISNKWKCIVFCYSALFGMLTHIVWDSFTHINGFMVKNYPIFTHTFHIYGFNIPLYKFLQHGSTLFGITIIIGYMYYRALSQRNLKKVNVPPKQKVIFWISLCLITTLFVLLWYLIDYVTNYGIIVVRIIDSSLMSLFIISLLFNRQSSK